MKGWRLLLLIVAAALLGGCATPQVASLRQHPPPDLAPSASIGSVPFYPQEDYQCGPAALAMVATAAGVPLNPEDLIEQVYLPGRKGSLQQEMLATGRRHGLLTYRIRPDVETLLREVAAGNPVIVLQNLGLSVMPVWHYAVAIGYDRHRNVLVLHSGRTPRLEMSLFTFERTWARSGHWAMLAMPPDRLPVTASADTYVAAAAALERSNPAAAQLAYASALKTWPDHGAAWLGLGNAAYAQGKGDAAAEAYRSLLARHQDFADAWNNLAQVLFEQGRLDAASDAISRAVSLGGPRQHRYRELQQQIEAAQHSPRVAAPAESQP